MVSCKDNVLDLHILSDCLSGIVDACYCIYLSKCHSASTRVFNMLLAIIYVAA